MCLRLHYKLQHEVLECEYTEKKKKTELKVQKITSHIWEKYTESQTIRER